MRRTNVGEVFSHAVCSRFQWKHFRTGGGDGCYHVRLRCAVAGCPVVRLLKYDTTVSPPAILLDEYEDDNDHNH